MNVSRKIVRARTHADLSQAELARRIGVARSAVCEWEKGVREPSLRQLRDVAAALDVKVAELVA